MISQKELNELPNATLFSILWKDQLGNKWSSVGSNYDIGNIQMNGGKIIKVIQLGD